MTTALCFGGLLGLSLLLWLPSVVLLRNAAGRRRIFERHHFVVGAALVALGYALHARWLVWLGLSMMLDDGGMHFAQLAFGVRSEVEGGPTWVYHTAYRYLLVEPLTSVAVWFGWATLARWLVK